MSVERMFDKLDEKISSLIRSLGLIITILFGSIALLINFKIENILIKVSILGLIGIFVSNIIFTLALYISTKKDEFVYNIPLYEQLLKINRGLVKETNKELIVLINQYEMIKRKLPSLEEFYIELFIKYNVQKDTDGYYRLNLKNLEDFKSGLSIFIEIFNKIRKYFNVNINEIVSEIKSDKESDNLNSYFVEFAKFLGLVRTYHTDLSNFEGLQLFNDNEFVFNLLDIPFSLFTDFVNHLRFNSISAYNKINKDKLTKIKEYGFNIKIAYGIFGLGIILSSVMIFYALILFFFFN